MSTEIHCPKCNHFFVVPEPARDESGRQVCAYCRRSAWICHPYNGEIVCIKCIAAITEIGNALAREDAESTAAALKRLGYVEAGT